MGDYYKSKESVEEYIKLAKDVSGKDLIEKLKVFLQSNTSILEIGTGPGTDWKILNKDFDTVGSDNSLEFIRYLVSENPKGKFLELDAITLRTNEKFDCIYSNKVLHHLSDDDLVTSINSQCKVLKQNGIICHSFWKGVDSEIFKGLFVNYHLEDSLLNFFEPSFETLLIEEYAEFEEGDSLLFIGKKKD